MKLTPVDRMRLPRYGDNTVGMRGKRAARTALRRRLRGECRVTPLGGQECDCRSHENVQVLRVDAEVYGERCILWKRCCDDVVSEPADEADQIILRERGCAVAGTSDNVPWL